MYKFTRVGHVHEHTRPFLLTASRKRRLSGGGRRGRVPRRENPLASEAWIIALQAIDALLPVAIREREKERERESEKGGEARFAAIAACPSTWKS